MNHKTKTYHDSVVTKRLSVKNISFFFLYVTVRLRICKSSKIIFDFISYILFLALNMLYANFSLNSVLRFPAADKSISFVRCDLLRLHYLACFFLQSSKPHINEETGVLNFQHWLSTLSRNFRAP